MTTRQPSRTNRSRPRTRNIVAAAAAFAAALPLVLAAPAQASPASTSSSDHDYSCTVKAKKPYDTGDHKWGKKVVDYPVSIYCHKDRYLNIKQQYWEYDGKHDDDYDHDYDHHGDGHDYLGAYNWHKVYVEHGKWTTLHSYKLLHHTPDDDYTEEVFHKVKYQERHHDGWSYWSGWHSSHYAPIHH